ncbi:hypothetical protein E4U21_002409 [Claviceps maximensis]|nr:hypothetical protein E4U21_002409 [Claviceps maximensis]
MARMREITLVHFNDVYHVSDIDHVARFASIMADPRYVNTTTEDASPPEHILRVFSGDVFSPSPEAPVFRGAHMPAVLDAMKVDVACYGNHDFDFGESRLAELSDMTGFPWTLTNVLRRDDGDGDASSSRLAGPLGVSGGPNRLLARAREYVVREVDGVRIGFFGLAGTDWPSTCLPLPPCDIKDPATSAQSTARQLREQEKCDIVIALTHMRLAEDLAVSKKTQTGSGRVDLLLGGHDHDVVQRASADSDADPTVAWESLHPADEGGGGLVSVSGDVRIVKSGTDWKGLSIVRLGVAENSDGSYSISHTTVTQVSNVKNLPNYTKIPLCPTTMRVMADIRAKVAEVVTNPIVMTDVPLEGRSCVVRRRETNLGNMLADMVRAYYDTDIALVNSGGIRCDRILGRKLTEPLLVRDIMNINPFNNALVVRRVSGRVLAQALENSVSDAHTDGRFLQVSGLRMTVDWSRREGERIVGDIECVPSGNVSRIPAHSIMVSPEATYTVAMVKFIASGFGGYTCFRDSESLVDIEGAIRDTNLLLQVFKEDAAEAEAEAAAGTRDKKDDGSTVGEMAERIRRARKAVVTRRDAVTGLPVISPCVDGRINVVSK